MQIIPIQDVPSQSLTVNLAGQQTQINIYTRATGLYCDIMVNNSMIVGGVACVNLARMVQNTYLGFVGDLAWNDSQGDTAPSSPGLGTRYILYYITAQELNGAG